MQIHYCDKCNSRIPEADVSMGLVFTTEEGNLVCPFCWKKMQEHSRAETHAEPAVRPVTGQFEPIKRRRTTGLHRRVSAARTRKTTSSSTVWIAVAGFVVAVVAGVAAAPRLISKSGDTKGDDDTTASGTAKIPEASGKGGASKQVEPGEASGGSSQAHGALPEGETPADKGPPEPEEPTSREPAEAEEPTKLELAEKAYGEICDLLSRNELAAAEALLAESASVLSAPVLEETRFAAEAAKKITEKKVAKALAEAERLVVEEDFASALALVDEALAYGGESEQAEALRTMKEKCQAAVDRIEARKADQERREAAMRLTADARVKAEAEDFNAALDLLSKALVLADTEELRAEVSRVTFLKHAAEGERLAEAGKIEAAIEAYGKALKIREDPDLAERVAELEKRREFAGLVRLARSKASRGDNAGAVESYTKAKELAPDDHARRSIEMAIEGLQVQGLLTEAKGHIRSRRWRKAERLAVLALRRRPGLAEAKRILAEAREWLLPKRLAGPEGIVLVLVPAGAFQMGSQDGARDERPAHRVTLSAYYIGRTEVTNEQYEAFDPGHRGRRGRGSRGDEHPVGNVAYEDAVKFCEWLSEEDGAWYRLPTEAEWERAARGTDGREYPWGAEAPGARGAFRCNFGLRARKGWGRDGFVAAAPAGSFAEWESPARCLDMAGNVAEWCVDWYAEDYYEKGERRNPTGPPEGRTRGVRGGSWKSGALAVRTTARAHLAPRRAFPDVGFRVVREVEVATGLGGPATE